MSELSRLGLSHTDCGRLLEILDKVIGATDSTDFCKRLLDGLADGLGWDSSLAIGNLPTAGRSAWSEPQIVSHTAASDFVADYAGNWLFRDPMIGDRPAPNVSDVRLLSVRLRNGDPAAEAYRRHALDPHGFGDVVAFEVCSLARRIQIQVFFGSGSASRRELSIARRLGRHLAPLLPDSGVPAGPDSGATLSAREHQIASLVASGLTNDDIGSTLQISVPTVKKHVTQILRKSGCSSRTAFTRLWWTTLPAASGR